MKGVLKVERRETSVEGLPAASDGKSTVGGACWHAIRSRHRVPARSYDEMQNRSGFTLLEVLLAFAMFAVAVVVLASSYLNIITSLEAVKSDRSFDQEVRWVREQVLQQADRAELEKGGELRSPENGTVRWQAAVFPTLVADLFTVELTVELVVENEDKRAEPREHTERITVLRPSWSEPVERGKLFEEAKQRIEEDRRRRGVVPEQDGKAGKRT